MLGAIDLVKKPVKPRLFLARPNREIIGRLSEAYQIQHDMKLTSLNEMTFSLPYFIESHHKRIRNPNIDKLRERYLVLVKLGSQDEWYMVINPTDSMDPDKDVKTIHAISLGYEIADKNIRYLQLESKNMKEALNAVLAETLWSIDYMDADFELTYRDFEFSSVTALEAVFQIVEKFNAVIRWNTIDRTISLIKPEYTGINKGLKFKYGQYLKNLSKESKADEMVTRLKAFGKDGMSMESVNPTGQNYIEDFSFFIYPFARDPNRNVLKSSEYMSDSLCHALLDYSDLVESKKGQFSNLLKQKEQLISTRSTKEAELNKLKTDLTKIIDTRTLQQFDNQMWFEKFTYHGSATSKSFQIRPYYSYALLCKVSDATNITVSVNGSVQSVISGQWAVIGKLKQQTSASVQISGSSSSTEVFIQVANITEHEYLSVEDSRIIDKYSQDNKEMQIALKENELNTVNAQIESVNHDIKVLMDMIAIENNLTSEQLQELNPFIITREFADDNYIDPYDLYKDAQEKFEELRKPQMVINIDIVNFLEIVTEQRNWHKLVLGDDVTIEYERIGIKVTAKIIEISYDHESSSINLTIANVKDISDDHKKFEKFIQKGINTSATVDFNKNKWTKTIYRSGEISEILDRFWNKVTNEINMASNEFVTLDQTGLTIIDPNDPMRFLRATHGALALTRSGGLRYETAITADGIIAERLLGKILLTERVVIGDDDNILEIHGARAKITDLCDREVMKFGLVAENPNQFGILLNRYESEDCDSKTIINRVMMDRDDGFTIERRKGTGFDKTFYTSLDGDLYMKGNFQAGEGERIFKVTHQGLQLGGSVWETAPLHADMFGNVWMNRLFADTAEIKNSLFKDGHIEGSSLTLRDGAGVFKIFPKIGMWAGAEEFNDAPFSVDLEGNLKARKARFYGKAGNLLIDTDAGLVDFGGFDAEGIARLTAELITSKMLIANEGYINDLTVNRLKTLGAEKNEGDFVDHIDIKDNIAAWITGEVTGKEQAKDSKGRLLYFTDNTKKLVTTENTGIPFFSYAFKNTWVKRSIFFVERNGNTPSYPVDTFGVGDGAVTSDPLKMSGKGYIKKPDQEMGIEYYANNSADERSIKLRDNGILVSSKNETFEVQCKKFKVISDKDEIAIEHSAGTKIQIDSAGNIVKLNHKNGSYIELSPTGGKINVVGNLDILATGQVKISGSRIDLN